MDHCLTFLRCLARTYPPEFQSVSKPQFFRGWNALQRRHRPNNGYTSPVYYVRTDFRDAFTSFKQGKLLAVVWQRISERFGNRSQALRVHSVDVVKVGGGSGTVYCKKRKYCDGLPVPNFPSGSLVFYDGTTAVPLDRIWNVVRKCVRRNAVEWRGRRWVMTRGVVQGDRLSVALCDLLLADLQATRLERAISDSGAASQLYRFVDDYVFVSHDRAAASRFLTVMCAGFDEYGLRLNHSKTKTNLKEDGSSGETVKFLGFRLNPTTGEVTKDVSVYRNQRPLHFFDYELGRGFPGQTLYAKIIRPNQHPLPVALVCKSFNSVTIVARNLAFVVALKAFAVVTAIKQYFFHLNPTFVLKTVHAIARLMYGKVCGLIRRSAVTPSQCKWIVYEVYATMFQVHFSDSDSRITYIADQLRRCQSAIGQKCNDRILKMALKRCGFAKIFG
jgi:telomerase reverse transcriptase